MNDSHHVATVSVKDKIQLERNAVARHSPPTYNPNGTVAEALGLYFDTYGLGDGGYDKPHHLIRLFGFLPILLPNPPARKRALRRHDLNRILGDFDAILASGEIDIAGFEIGSDGGCRGYAVAWIINSFFFALGVLSRPKHPFCAFVRSRGAQNAYSLESVEGAILDRKLGEVRAELNIGDRAAAPRWEDRLYFHYNPTLHGRSNPGQALDVPGSLGVNDRNDVLGRLP